ncbi:6-phosphofructokinase [Nitrospina watsonii]|uniref:6-phosphofructokinase n=1 Tax=Nitrospina watsonii TaxID=1323948 RepID=A0ABM9HHG1_9BACT|nr:6-phosphofructokinase [Nitrospina watsonii]CAI2719699.1 putative 6-phosphofructokinase [Nitrospina watsonii]
MRHGWLKFFEYFLEKKRAEYARRPFTPYPHYLAPFFEPPDRNLSTDPKILERVDAVLEGLHRFFEELGEPSGTVTFREYCERKRNFIEAACRGNELLYAIAWNEAIGDAAFRRRITRAKIGRGYQKPRQRPRVLVDRNNVSASLLEGKIIVDLPNNKLLLLPEKLEERAILSVLRHGASKGNSSDYKIGCLYRNYLERPQGFDRAKRVGREFGRMIHHANLTVELKTSVNYLQTRNQPVYVSRSPNTRQLAGIIRSVLQDQNSYRDRRPMVYHEALDSQNFGLLTGESKEEERGQLCRFLNVSEDEGKRILKDPLFCYPGGETFYENYQSTVEGVHEIAHNHPGAHVSLFTHSSMMRALMIYLDMRPFAEAYYEYMAYQEGQDNAIFLIYEEGLFSSYSCAVGLSREEEEAIKREEEARQQEEDHLRSIIEITRSEVNRIALITSGGDAPGMNAVLKAFIDKCLSFGVKPYVFRKGIEGVFKNDGQEYTEESQRKLLASSGSVIQCNKRFRDIEQEGAEYQAIDSLRKHQCDALIVLGGDGSVRMSNKLFRAGYPVVALPASIDNDLPVYCLGFDSALNATIGLIQMLEWTSRSMERVHFAEVYGAGSGHFALALAHAVNPEAVLVSEMREIGVDIDAFIDTYLVDKLIYSLKKRDKSHIVIVSEMLKHRHVIDPKGGVSGLASAIEARLRDRGVEVEARESVFAHLQRGAPVSRLDREYGQDLGRETVFRIKTDLGRFAGKLLGREYPSSETWTTLPLHALPKRQFRWDIYKEVNRPVINAAAEDDRL